MGFLLGNNLLPYRSDTRDTPLPMGCSSKTGISPGWGCMNKVMEYTRCAIYPFDGNLTIINNNFTHEPNGFGFGPHSCGYLLKLAFFRQAHLALNHWDLGAAHGFKPRWKVMTSASPTGTIVLTGGWLLQQGSKNHQSDMGMLGV